jgi:hypothetical protein
MAFWVALAVLVVAVVAGIAFAAVRGFQLYRNAKRVGGVLGPEMERINATTLKIEGHMAKAEAAAGRLQDAAGRLARSRARLDVQLAAVREAQRLVRRVFWFVPGI